MLTYSTPELAQQFPHRTQAAYKLARLVATGADRKKTVTKAGRHRLWSQTTGAEIRVGRHGKGQPLVVVRRGEL